MKKFLKTLINIVLIAILIYSGYNIYNKLTQYKKADKTYTEVRTEKKETLNDKNPDFKFWLKVDNTNIDYPVVQSKDNQYYLNKDFYNQDSNSGSIFMDYRDNTNSQNTILYGHNMRNKTMFNNLLKFKDQDFFNQNNKIRVIKDGKEYIYEVFSVYTIDAGYDYLIPNFSNSESFKQYIKDIK
ncbi:MAG: class B sortase, partial [Paraclostridium sp.]